MKQFTRHIVKLVVAASIIMVSATCIVISMVIIGNVSAQQEITEQLVEIDRLFIASRRSIPSSVTDETLLPKRVGDFERSEIFRYTDGCYGWSFKSIRVCSSTIYARPKSVDDTGRNDVVWVDIWQITSDNPKTLDDMVGTYPCGAELGGEFHPRSEANQMYAYRTCSAFLTGAPSLNSVIWENNHWIIAIEGQYEGLSRFIDDYPY